MNSVEEYFLILQELRDLYSSPRIIRMIKLRKRWAGHVARMEKRKVIGLKARGENTTITRMRLVKVESFNPFHSLFVYKYKSEFHITLTNGLKNTSYLYDTSSKRSQPFKLWHGLWAAAI
jgi:hypothetical protein